MQSLHVRSRSLRGSRPASALAPPGGAVRAGSRTGRGATSGRECSPRTSTTTSTRSRRSSSTAPRPRRGRRLRRVRARPRHPRRPRSSMRGSSSGSFQRRCRCRVRGPARVERRFRGRGDHHGRRLAAMAPQTNIGSSTPISLGGEDISKDLRRKVDQRRGGVRRRARARARPERRGRPRDGHQGVELRRAPGGGDRPRRGRRSDAPGSARRDRRHEDRSQGLVLHTAGADVEDVEMTFWQRARDLLVDPNLIAIMLSIGLLGIVVELWNPGLILPGTVGAISLILGPVRAPGAPRVRRGALAAAARRRRSSSQRRSSRRTARSRSPARVTFVLGALILFDPAGEAYQVSLPVALAIAGTLARPARDRVDASRARRAPAGGRGCSRPRRRRRARSSATGSSS